MDTTLEPLDAEQFPDLSDRQRAAIPIVLASATLRAGLDAAEVPTTTWYRWMADDRFGDAFRRCQRQVLSEALGDLQSGIRFAVRGLLGLMTSKSEQVRLAACREVLGAGLRTVEILELADRITALEDALVPIIAEADLS